MAKQKIPADPNLGRNLKFLMDQRYALGTQTKLASKTGLSQSSIGRILRGEVNPSSAALNRIAEEFQIDVGDFYLDETAFADRHMSAHNRGLRELDSAVDGMRRYAERIAKGQVPLLTWATVGADEKVDSESVAWVVCPVEHSKKAFAIEVQSLGMFDPTGSISFAEGDRVFVDQSRPAKHRSIVIIRLADGKEATMRQLIAEDGHWLLLQLNPSWPSRITPLRTEDSILGVVIAKVQIFE